MYLADIGTPAPDEPGVELPYVSVLLKAPGVSLRLDGQLRLSPEAGRLEAHFTDLPDVPLSDFKLGFYGGRAGHAGPFTNVVDLCAAEFAPSDAALLSQAGQRSEQQPVLDAAACRQGALVAGAASGLASSRPRMSVAIARAPSSAHALRRATVVVPAGPRGAAGAGGRRGGRAGRRAAAVAQALVVVAGRASSSCACRVRVARSGSAWP